MSISEDRSEANTRLQEKLNACLHRGQKYSQATQYALQTQFSLQQTFLRPVFAINIRQCLAFRNRSVVCFASIGAPVARDRFACTRYVVTRGT
jgi:hypothetical protein